MTASKQDDTRHTPIRRLWFRPVFCALGLVLVVASRGPAAPQQPTFGEEALVFEVQVPIHVVDRDGQPVRGLTAASFQVYDEGVRQEVTDLEIIDLETVLPGAAATEIERALPPSARRHFLLLFDLSFSSPSALIKARHAARQFALGVLHPTDLVAVATHTLEDGAQLLVTFTPDRAQVARAIDTLGAPRLLAAGRQDPLRFILEDPATRGVEAARDTTAGGGSQETDALRQSIAAHLRIIGTQMARVERSFSRGRVSSWTASMADLARLLDSVGGRKQVVYFSEGFDGELMLGRQPDALDPDQQRDQLALQRGEYWMVDTDEVFGNAPLLSDVGHMLEEFRRADCAIHVVDISGLGADLPEERRVKRVGQDALFYVANETGGELVEEANDLGRRLEGVLARSTVSYVLTFRPTQIEPDGAYHRLKIRADLPRGTRLSHRPGYFAPRPFEQLHPLERNLLAADDIASAVPRHDLAMNVLAAPFRATAEVAYVPLILEVDGASLLAGQQGDDLAVELYAYATDERGEMRDFFTQRVGLDLSRSRETFERTGLKYYGHLDLPSGSYLIRVLARNAMTGRTGVHTMDLQVPSLDDGKPFLLPPFFPEPQGRWFLVREEIPGGDSRSVVYPFTIEGDVYVPAAHPTVPRRGEVRLYVTAYNLEGDELELTGTLLDAKGEPAAGGQITLEERTATGIHGVDKLVATFHPEGLPAGRYTLEVAVKDRADRLLAVAATTPLTVVN